MNSPHRVFLFKAPIPLCQVNKATQRIAPTSPGACIPRTALLSTLPLHMLLQFKESPYGLFEMHFDIKLNSI